MPHNSIDIIVVAAGASQTVLQRDEEQGDGWHKAVVALTSIQPYRIAIEHTRGGMNVETGLAVDDVLVSNQMCRKKCLYICSKFICRTAVT